MGCIVSLIRAGVALVLGFVVFFGFLFYLILNNFSDKLLNADFYNDTISGQDAYNRIYDEVLVDQELRDKTTDLLGNIKVVSHDELVSLLRDILPPDYLQSQMEGSIQRTIDYLDEETGELEAYVELGPPLENAKAKLFDYIDGKIDELEVEEAVVSDCSISTINRLAARYVERFDQLADGQVPATIPSLQSLSQECRALVFAATFDQLTGNSLLGAEARRQLRQSREAIRQPFVAGDTLGVLKVAARPLANPLIDDAIAEVRKELEPGDRLDLIKQLAEWDDTITEAEIRNEIAEGRTWLNRARGFGDLTTLVMVIAGVIIMGLIHLPSLANALRWPGITLLLTGVFFFVTGKVLESQVPDRLKDLVDQEANQVTNVPQAVTDLGGDLLISFGARLTDGFAGPSLAMLIVGAILLGGSFFVFLVKPFLPFVK